jgi:hypothetical protein
MWVYSIFEKGKELKFAVCSAYDLLQIKKLKKELLIP